MNWHEFIHRCPYCEMTFDTLKEKEEHLFLLHCKEIWWGNNKK